LELISSGGRQSAMAGLGAAFALVTARDVEFC